MESASDRFDLVVNKSVEKYSEENVLRVLIQAVPHIGIAIENLLSGKATLIQRIRIEHFVNELSGRMKVVDKVKANIEDDAFMDLMLSTLEEVSRTRSGSKRSRFADVIVKQVVESHPWEDAEMAVRLISEMEDLHIEVLNVVLSAPLCNREFNGLRVITLVRPEINDPEKISPTVISDALPHYSLIALRMACAELTAKGLLHDEGTGRWDTGAMQHFSPTDLANWFQEWLVGGD